MSKIKLGDNTFIGTVAKVFGSRELSNFLSDVQQGNVTLLFDAFDEAEVISGTEAVEKFIREIYQYCSASKKLNVIFFSRSETASTLSMILDDLGKNVNIYTMYEIDYFDKSGSYSFIKHYLRENGDENYEHHPLPFEKALDNIFATIGRGLDKNEKNIWENREIRTFIGYSPVLQTMASFILLQNYEFIGNQFADEKSEVEGIKVISKFIEELLIREQKKIISAVKQKVKKIPSGWNDWESLYQPEHQIKFIID